SVLRGNVLPEIEAIIDQLGLGHALLAPANPSFNQIIRDGIYYVHERPIAETDFARDPEHPRRSSQVLQLLAAQDIRRPHLVKAGEALPQSGIAIAEVSSLSDVQHWAQRQTSHLLCTGDAEFFTALLQQSISNTNPAPHHPHQSDAVTYERQCELFVCGSIS